jgi:hypothetical protein
MTKKQVKKQAKKRKATRRDRSIATLTIRGADKMTAEDRLEVARWLHRQAADLTEHGHRYSSRFVGRYMAK